MFARDMQLWSRRSYVIHENRFVSMSRHDYGGRPFLLVLAESLASEISRLFPTLDLILLKNVYWFWKYKTVYPFFCPAIFLPDMLVRTALVGTPRKNFCLDFLHVHDVSRIHVNAAYIIHYDEKWKFVLPRNMNSIYLNKGWK